MNIRKILFLSFVAAIIPIFVFAETKTGQTKEEVFSSFQSKATVENLNFVVPTVVETNISNNDITRATFAVYDKTSQNFISNLFVENYLLPQKPYEVRSNANKDLYQVYDGNYETFSDFVLSDPGLNRDTLRVLYNEPITTDSLSLSLDRYVSLPNEISISYIDTNGVDQIIVNKIKPTNTYINFPKITSKLFFINLSFTQPLRISEISFTERDLEKKNVSSLRFLSQPNHQYEVYLNPDRSVYISGITESPNLNNKEVIKKIGALNVVNNTAYVKSDIDEDKIPDEIDNCVRVSNSDQADVDGNGRGDVCDDFDQDGIINSKDNCVNDPNREQIDTDNDGMGDTCDGEESRITEKYPALVWGGIVFAVIVLLALYFVAFRSMKAGAGVKSGENSEKSDSQ